MSTLNVRDDVRALEPRAALAILQSIHRYAETGRGQVKPLDGKLSGLLPLRVGNHRVVFEESAEAITIHRVRDRREVYR